MAKKLDASTLQKADISREDIDAHILIMQKELDELTDIFTEQEDVYNQNWTDAPKSESGSEIKTVVSSKASNAVDSVVRLLSTSKPQATAEPLGKGEGKKKEANDLEKSMQLLLDKSSRQQGANTVSEAVAMPTIYGRSIVKVADLRAAFKFRGMSGYKDFPRNISPIVFKTVNPANVCYEQSEYGLSAVCEITERTVGDVKRSYGDNAAWLEGNPDEKVTVRDYWTYSPFDAKGGVHCVYLDGHDEYIIKPVYHQLDFLPYSIRNAYSMSFLPNSKDKVISMLSKLTKSKLWSRYNLLLTILATNVVMFVNPKWVSNTMDGAKVNVDMSKPSGVIPLRIGESISPLARQIVPKEVYDLLTITTSEIEEATLPRVVAGSAPGGVSAGYALNMLNESGKLALYPIEMVVNDTLTDAGIIALSFIAQGKHDVELNDELTITPKIAETYRHRFNWKLRSSVPRDKIAVGNLWSQLIGAGVGDPMTMWEEMGFSDTTQQMDRLLEWVFIQKNVERFAEREGSKVFGNALKQKQLPSQVQPSAMGGAQPVPPDPATQAAIAQAQSMMQGGGAPPMPPKGGAPSVEGIP